LGLRSKEPAAGDALSENSGRQDMKADRALLGFALVGLASADPGAPELHGNKYEDLERLKRITEADLGTIYQDGVKMAHMWHKQYRLGWRPDDRDAMLRQNEVICETIGNATLKLRPNELVAWLNREYKELYDIKFNPQLMLLKSFRWERIRHMAGSYVAEAALLDMHEGRRREMGYTLHEIFTAATHHVALKFFEEAMFEHGLLWKLAEFYRPQTPHDFWELEYNCQVMGSADLLPSQRRKVFEMCNHGLGHAAVVNALNVVLKKRVFGGCRQPAPFTLDFPAEDWKRVINHACDMCDGALTNTRYAAESVAPSKRRTDCYGGLYHSVFKYSILKYTGNNRPCHGMRNPQVCEARFFEFDMFLQSQEDIIKQLHEDDPRDPSQRAMFHCCLSMGVQWFVPQVHNVSSDTLVCPFEGVPLRRMTIWNWVAMMPSGLMGYWGLDADHVKGAPPINTGMNPMAAETEAQEAAKRLRAKLLAAHPALAEPAARRAPTFPMASAAIAAVGCSLFGALVVFATVRHGRRVIA
jgi:hypothetical protein